MCFSSFLLTLLQSFIVFFFNLFFLISFFFFLIFLLLCIYMARSQRIIISLSRRTRKNNNYVKRILRTESLDVRFPLRKTLKSGPCSLDGSALNPDQLPPPHLKSTHLPPLVISKSEEVQPSLRIGTERQVNITKDEADRIKSPALIKISKFNSSTPPLQRIFLVLEFSYL